MQNEFMHFFLNEFVTESRAKVSVHDLGFCRSYAVFDVLRTYNKKPFHLQDHLDRFFFACNKIKITLPYLRDDMIRFIYELIELNKLDCCSLKLLATGGFSPDGFHPPKIGNFYILYYPIISTPKTTIRVISTHCPRVFPHIKTTFYLPVLMQMQTSSDFDDIVYIDDKNYVLEGSRSNFFGIKGDVLITPKNKVLKGITKEVIKKVASPYFKVIEEDIHYDDLPSFDEIFLSASVSEIRRINTFDAYQFTKSEKTDFIRELFYAYINQGIWEPLHLEWEKEKNFSLNI